MNAIPFLFVITIMRLYTVAVASTYRTFIWRKSNVVSIVDKLTLLGVNCPVVLYSDFQIHDDWGGGGGGERITYVVARSQKAMLFPCIVTLMFPNLWMEECFCQINCNSKRL